MAGKLNDLIQKEGRVYDYDGGEAMSPGLTGREDVNVCALHKDFLFAVLGLEPRASCSC